MKVKPKSTAEGPPEKSQDDLPSAESKPTSTAVNLHKEPSLKEGNCEKVTGDEGINVQPCCEDMRLSRIKASG